MAHAGLRGRSRGSAAALTALAACGLLAAAVAAPAGASSTAAHHGAVAAKRVAHPNGFFVTDSSRAATSSTGEAALVRDSEGTEHVITSVASTTPDKGHLVYLTRKSGATKWTSHAISGLRPTNGGIRIEAHLDPADHVVVVIYECDGVYMASASPRATRMPEPTLVLAKSNCATAKAASDNPPTADAYATYNSSVGVLLPDPAQDNRQAIYTGEPGNSSIHITTAIPATDDITVSQVTYDAGSSEVVAVGEGTDGTTKGIYALKNRYYGGAWTQPVRIATLNSATADFRIESVTSYRNVIWVGLERPAVGGVAPKHRLYVVHGTASGQWDGLIPLPHATAKDSSLRLLINPDTRTLHAAFTRVTPGSHVAKSGIMQEARTGGRWSTPKYFTHWYRDVADEITINSAGKAVVSYEQR
jgi:hypothetical protein